MTRALALLGILGMLLVGCGPNTTDPKEGCRGHGGVKYLAQDATDGSIPFYCNDGTVGSVNP